MNTTKTQTEGDIRYTETPYPKSEQRDTAQPLPKLQVDECPDSNGFTTIRPYDGTRNGDTEAQPIATIYDVYNACLIVRACNTAAHAQRLAEALKQAILAYQTLSYELPNGPRRTRANESFTLQGGQFGWVTKANEVIAQFDASNLNQSSSTTAKG